MATKLFEIPEDFIDMLTWTQFHGEFDAIVQ